MNKFSKISIRVAAVTQIIALILLTGCATTGKALGNTSLIVCHATGDAENPYEEIDVTSTELSTHLAQDPNDISPVPTNGCPDGPLLVSNGMIIICHATGNALDPYDEVTVSAAGLGGHSTHENDIFPATEGGCPVNSDATPQVGKSDKVTICHITGSKKNPYTKITISVSGLNGHTKHDGDIIPAPADGCPTTKP